MTTHCLYSVYIVYNRQIKPRLTDSLKNFLSVYDKIVETKYP